MVNDANDKEVIGLRHIIIYYLRYWKLFAAAFAVSLVGALLYLLLVPKTYEIAASIQVQDERDLISSGSGFKRIVRILYKAFQRYMHNFSSTVIRLSGNYYVFKIIYRIGVYIV